MYRVRQQFERPTVDDVAATVVSQMVKPEVRATLEGAGTVAVAVGSRGIAGIDVMTRTVVDQLRASGIEPFVVPAMGSHGGATAEGQRAVLAHLGVTEATVGAPIRSGMETVQIAEVTTPRGKQVPVVTDAIAWNEADAVVPLNRVKPHTGFRGQVESGICKMLAVGLGKHEGAKRMHSEGYEVFDRLLLDMGAVILDAGRVAFGLAIVENAFEEPAIIEAIPASRVVEREQLLLDQAREWMPYLPFPVIDVLVVERFGKNISGVGMDPHVTGRGESGGPLPDFDGAEIARIVVLDLTPETEGNANGIGLADIITQRVFDGIDREVTWTNTLTAGALGCGRIPIALPTEDDAIAVAARTLAGIPADEARIVRVRDTLYLSEFAVSESLVPAVESLDHCELAGRWDGTWAIS